MHFRWPERTENGTSSSEGAAKRQRRDRASHAPSRSHGRGRSSQDADWDRDASADERERLALEHFAELKAKRDDEEMRANLDKCARANARYDRGIGKDESIKNATAVMHARTAALTLG